MAQRRSPDRPAIRGTLPLAPGLRSGTALALGPDAVVLGHPATLPAVFAPNLPLVGRKATELTPPVLGETLARLWHTCHDSQRPATVEVGLHPSAGAAESVCLSLRAAPHPRSPDIALVTVRDISPDRRRLDALAREVEGSRSRAAHWEATARTLAHDTRSSLAALQGFLTLASRSGEATPAPLQHALGVVSRLLDLTRTAEEAPVPAAAPEIAPIAEVASILFAELCAAHPGLAFSWCVRAGDPEARVPRTASANALWNVLTNAVKYRHPERPLHLEVKAWRAGPEVHVTVGDNGLGIAPDEREAVFLKGWRGRAAEGVPGSGLGLFSAARLVEGMGGRLSVEPSETGATLALALPAP